MNTRLQGILDSLARLVGTMTVGLLPAEAAHLRVHFPLHEFRQLDNWYYLVSPKFASDEAD